MNNKIEIPLSKTKIILLLLAAIAFVAGGIWIATNPERFIPNIFRITSPEIIRIGGIVGILFFGAAGVYGIKKIFDKNNIPDHIKDIPAIKPGSNIIASNTV